MSRRKIKSKSPKPVIVDIEEALYIKEVTEYKTSPQNIEEALYKAARQKYRQDHPNILKKTTEAIKDFSRGLVDGFRKVIEE